MKSYVTLFVVVVFAMSIPYAATACVRSEGNGAEDSALAAALCDGFPDEVVTVSVFTHDEAAEYGAILAVQEAPDPEPTRAELAVAARANVERVRKDVEERVRVAVERETERTAKMSSKARQEALRYARALVEGPGRHEILAAENAAERAEMDDTPYNAEQDAERASPLPGPAWPEQGTSIEMEVLAPFLATMQAQPARAKKILVGALDLLQTAHPLLKAEVRVVLWRLGEGRARVWASRDTPAGVVTYGGLGV